MKFIRKYYKLIIALVLLCIIVIPMLNRTTIEIYGYNTDNVYNTIKELSSEKYQGRRYGTEQNMDAVKYIEEQFKSIGLEPAGEDNTYLRLYRRNTRSYNGQAVMELVDDRGEIAKKYIYGQDFIEQSYGYSAPGELTSGFLFMDYGGESFVDSHEDGEEIVIANVSMHSQQILDSLAVALGKQNYKAVITAVPDDTNLRQDNSSIGSRRPNKTGYEIPSLIVKESVREELLSYQDKGYKLHIKSTFDSTFGDVADVYGMIPGSSDDYLFITSSLDGVGVSSDGIMYPGALDNASGVGAMLEIARFLKSQDKVPSKNIVFIAFNCTKGGMLGSLNFVFSNAYPLYKISVINLDMIGGSGNNPISLLYNDVSNSKLTKDPSSKMRYHLKKLGESMGMQVNEVKDSSTDHYIFTRMDVPAVTISDYDTALAGTPEDTLDRINMDNIDRAMELTLSYVSMTAYSNISAGGYNIGLQEAVNLVSFLYPLFIGLVVFVVLAYLRIRHRKHDEKTRVKAKIPLLTVAALIILISIVGYFPIKYVYGPSNTTPVVGLIFESFLSLLKSIVVMPIYCGIGAIGAIVILRANRRAINIKYKGDGSEMKYFYYLSTVLVVLLSLIIALLYSSPLYLIVTPDFAKSFGGILLLYACFAAIAYMLAKLMCGEADIKPRSYGNLIIFTVILTVMLSSFYMPIATNKAAMDSKSTSISIGTVVESNLPF